MIASEVGFIDGLPEPDHSDSFLINNISNLLLLPQSCIFSVLNTCDIIDCLTKILLVIQAKRPCFGFLLFPVGIGIAIIGRSVFPFIIYFVILIFILLWFYYVIFSVSATQWTSLKVILNRVGFSLLWIILSLRINSNGVGWSFLLIILSFWSFDLVKL